LEAVIKNLHLISCASVWLFKKEAFKRIMVLVKNNSDYYNKDDGVGLETQNISSDV
jgi:Zn-finger domain-containing protein